MCTLLQFDQVKSHSFNDVNSDPLRENTRTASLLSPSGRHHTHLVRRSHWWKRQQLRQLFLRRATLPPSRKTRTSSVRPFHIPKWTVRVGHVRRSISMRVVWFLLRGPPVVRPPRGSTRYVRRFGSHVAGSVPNAQRAARTWEEGERWRARPGCCGERSRTHAALFATRAHATAAKKHSASHVQLSHPIAHDAARHEIN